MSGWQRLLTDDQARDLVQRIRDGYSTTAEAARLDVHPSTVSRIVNGSHPGYFHIFPVKPWKAACMDEYEWAAWVDGNVPPTPRPCDDCSFGFAAEMAAKGRCNGIPAGIPDDDEEAA